MKQVIVTKVSKGRWQAAQAFEVEAIRSVVEAQDDWNHWWRNKFDDYRLLKGKHFKSVMEVGCGPFTNLRFILPQIKTENIFLEDPLLQSYMDFRTGVLPQSRASRILGRPAPQPAPVFIQQLFKDPSYRVHLSSAPLEELPFNDGLTDLVVCINVLDHVFDVETCMRQMDRVLKPGGFLVLGQDLSNEEDYAQAPESWKDVGHPIKLDESELEKYFKNYRALFKKILPRKAGRNPDAHYGTYLLIARKKAGPTK